MTKWVEWDEPWGDLGGSNYLPIILRARVDDVMAFQRRREPRYESDLKALDDFVCIHWGRIVDDRPS